MFNLCYDYKFIEQIDLTLCDWDQRNVIQNHISICLNCRNFQRGKHQSIYFSKRTGTDLDLDRITVIHWSKDINTTRVRQVIYLSGVHLTISLKVLAGSSTVCILMKISSGSRFQSLIVFGISWSDGNYYVVIELA